MCMVQLLLFIYGISYFIFLKLKMELDEMKEAERFVDEFKQIDFQVPFDNLKR